MNTYAYIYIYIYIYHVCVDFFLQGASMVMPPEPSASALRNSSSILQGGIFLLRFSPRRLDR